MSPSHYLPALNKYLENLKKSRFRTKRVGNEVELNPGVNLDGLDDNSTVSFVPMEAVAENATGEVVLQSRALGAVKEGYTAFQDGDVLYAKITPCMQNGKSFVAEGLHNGTGFGSTEFHVLRPSSNELRPEYLHIFISHSNLRELARYAFSGSAGHQRLPESFLAQLPLPLPPPEVQGQIVAEYRLRRESARRLRTQAEADWQTAKRWFEEQLLGSAEA